MTSKLEAVIAQMVIRQYPEITRLIRQLKREGASLLTVRAKVQEVTAGSDLLWNALSIAIDYVWHEGRKAENEDTESSSTDHL